MEQARRERWRRQNLQIEGAIARQELEIARLLEVTLLRQLEVSQRQVESATADVMAAKEALALLHAQRQDPDYLLDVYSARMSSMEAELDKIADDVVRSQIRSPIDGKVLRVLQESARYIQAGSPLLEVGNPSDLELVVDVLSTDAVKIKPGAKMLIERWGGDRNLEARVRSIEPSAFTKVSALGVEEQRVNVIANFVERAVPLGDAYRLETRIVVWEGRNVLTVPLNALFRCQENWCAFVVENGHAKKCQVEVSHRNNLVAAIPDGLVEGEKVILNPSQEMQEGTQVADR